MSNTNSNSLAVGDRIDISINGRAAACKVADITRDGNLIVTQPVYGNSTVSIPKDELLKIVYFKESGMFLFFAVFVRNVGEGELMSELQIKSLISKYQRRDFVRFECKRPLRLRVLKDNSENAPAYLKSGYAYRRNKAGRYAPEDEIESVMVDISGGGICFKSEKSLPNGTMLECHIGLREDDWITTDGVVVRTDELGSGAPGYKISVQFVGIGEDVRRKIIKFIFEEQIKLRKKQTKMTS